MADGGGNLPRTLDGLIEDVFAPFVGAEVRGA
jgi:hypothetical protein